MTAKTFSGRVYLVVVVTAATVFLSINHFHTSSVGTPRAPEDDEAPNAQAIGDRIGVSLPGAAIESVNATVKQNTIASIRVKYVSVHASEEDAPGLADWISMVLLVERPNIVEYQVISVDTNVVLSNPEQFQLQLVSQQVFTVSKTISVELPGGGIKWAGDIHGMDGGSLNIEISPNGEAIIRVSSEEGRIYVRPSPMLPYHVAYKQNPTFDIKENL